MEAIKDLRFDEQKHIYTVKGIKIQSVSHFLKPIANAVYGDIDEQILRIAAERGKAVHFSIEILDQYCYKEIAPELIGYLDAYEAWKNKYTPRIVANEYRIYHKAYWYAGTTDKIISFEDCFMDSKNAIGEPGLYVHDIKTTSSLMGWFVVLQLSAYEEALKSHGIEIKGRCALHLMPDGKYHFEIYPKSEFTMFLNCLNLQNYIQKNKGVFNSE